ncbi:MAG: inositol monophosphatase [Candidatus Cloacimonetes bacterium]|nr:inositol monophosphatase [Candidatus Cloacimonadota bacterium]
MIDFLLEIIRKAGDIVREAYLETDSEISHKGDVDLVTECDLASEAFLVSAIRRQFPGHAILTEEQNIISPSSDHLWIIDPLDGTTNFAHRYPFLAVSIAYQMEGSIVAGAVYNPILQELFQAEAGAGAYLNGQPIRVSEKTDLSQALVATGFPYDRWQRGDFYIQEYLAFLKRAQGVRRAGAAAIDLCYVACGRLDGFFERKLHPWDLAAGSFILQEAGGNVTSYERKDWHYTMDTVIASNGLIHHDMQTILASVHG